jgi:transcriptional regulator with XRE-family HTH domain
MRKRDLTFGEFIRQKRLDGGQLTLKDIGTALGISLTHYSDIEHGRRSPGGELNYEKLAYLLRLTEEEKALMYDLAAKKRDSVPSDIKDVMMNSESGNMARMALRMTKAGIAKEDDWKEFIRQLERKKREEQKE